jgi:hypothetical protein
LISDPRWAPDTKTDWPTDCQLVYYFDFGNTVVYLLKARIMELQQPAVTRQRPVNNNSGMVFSVQSMPMATHPTVAYVIPSLSNKCATRDERRFLGSPCWDVISTSRLGSNPSSRQRGCYIRTMTRVQLVSTFAGRRW